MEQQEIARRLHLSVDQVQAAQESAFRKFRRAFEAAGLTRDVVFSVLNPPMRRSAFAHVDDPPPDPTLRLLRSLFGCDDDAGDAPGDDA